MRPYVALLIGAPGGGKGTIGKYIVRDFDFRHVSTGDLLRQNIAMESPAGKEAAHFIARGRLVPDLIIIELVATELRRGAQRLLLDGFPRTAPQAASLDASTPVAAAINLDIPHAVIVERLGNRWIHGPSGRTYSYDFSPPKVRGIDDETGDLLIQREDDEPSTVEARLRTYREQTRPVVDHYRKRGILASFEGTESKVIYDAVKRFLDSDIRRHAAQP
ncbi:hypothetical protein CTAYLR_002338 [Chrysophaeum taylorii]|uniref:Adenylate kinase active site lid domain-containing protein n=1 Tax=Chrysophaeum taylorii TaxID=2483200 RepID=A0AAD7XK04_9STRA|nr:hypothetical protein CTAYLR_002338 [Chrysophaeum taylorii]